jgi:ankyrin repeat protein
MDGRRADDQQHGRQGNDYLNSTVRDSTDSRRADDQQRGRQGNDYHNPTVGDNGRAVFGNIIGNNCSMSVLVPERPEKTVHEKKEDFLKSLRFDVMESRLATIGIAHRDTCSWLYTRAEYLRWQDPEYRAEHHGFLWIKGKPGAGKSTLMKHALQHAQSLDQSDTNIISFFFNARGHELEKTTDGMYRSLLHQVYKAFPDRLPEIPPSDSAGSKGRVWQLEILQHMLREALLNFGHTAQFICYIDALDECNEDAIRLAIEYFEELGELAISQDVKILICFASRHYPNITMRRYQALDLDAQQDHQEDIQKFVKGKLGSTAITPSTHTELTEKILGRSSGVFLWAVLVVQILNKKMDDGARRSQLMEDLKKVPAGIEDLLKSILMGGGKSLLPTLIWVLFGYRSFDARNLYLAIIAGVNKLTGMTAEDWDHTETTEEQMRNFILKSSRGLVEFTRGRLPRAQFIHESIREYLLDGGLSILDDDLEENAGAKSHFRLATWCRNFIELDPHRDLRDSEVALNSFLSYALWNLYIHCEEAFKGGALQLEFLDAIPRSTQSLVNGYFSSTYQQRSLLCLLLDQPYSCICLAEGLLQRQLRHSSQVDACATAREDAMERTIPYFELNLSCDAKHDSTPLISAIRSILRGPKLHNMVQLLLDCGADPNCESWHGSPLILALEIYKNCATVELLLHHGANPNLALTRGTTNTPLAMAVQRSSTRCIEMLLKHGADANGSSAEFGKPLADAVSCDRQEIVRLLLTHGANPNGSSNHRPLHLAVGRGNGSMVRLLWESGADNKAKDEMGRSLLHTWCFGGVPPLSESLCEPSITRALIDASAEVSATDVIRTTFFVLAAGAGSPSLVQSLIDGGAEINATHSTSGTALIVAAKSGCLGVVQVLLDAGADINATDMTHRTALIMAAEMSNFDIVRLLIHRGADLDMHGQEEVVRYLRLRIAEEDAALSMVP